MLPENSELETMMLRMNPHYHITVISPSIPFNPIVTKDRTTSLNELGKTIKFVQDLTGLVPGNTIDNGTVKQYNFLDGTLVRWRLCVSDCLEPIDS